MEQKTTPKTIVLTEPLNGTNNSEVVFVTGSSGLVGAHLVKQLVQQGQQVKALYRAQIPPQLAHLPVQWEQGDILDVYDLEEAMQNAGKVYHCAAIVSFDPAQRNAMYKTNVEGTANVVNAALLTGVRKLVYVSSVAALGRVIQNNIVQVDETMTWTGETSESNYSKSKYLAEMEVWRGIAEGLNAVMVNPVVILGEADWTQGSAAMFKSGYNEFPWYTNGTGGYVDVLDVVNVMVQLMESNITGERFILCAEHKTYKEIFTMIAECFGRKAPHKNATRLMAAIVWRLEAVKASLSGNKPLLTRETAATALSTVHFNNKKLFKFLPHYTYTPLEQTIKRVCAEMKERYSLP